MNSNRLVPALLAVALFALPAAPALAQQAMPTASPTPMPTATPHPSGKPTPKPPRPARIGITGVWEVQIQHPNRTIYAHFSMHQSGETLTGTFLDPHGKKSRFAGSLSHDSMNIVVTLASGKVLRFESQLNGTTDMVGMFTDAKGKRIAFTASYRPKEKFFDSLSPLPGGLGGAGGLGTGSGGYNPPR